MAQIDRAHIGIGGKAVGDHAPVLDAGHQPLHRRMVDAQGGETVEGDGGDEIEEGLLQRFVAAVMVEMFGVDVGDDGDGRVQLGEGPVAFVGLDDHPLAMPEPGVASPAGDDAAIDHRGVDAGGVEKRRHQRGGRRLAMRSGDRHRPSKPHQLAQHLGAVNDRDEPLARRHELRDCRA